MDFYLFLTHSSPSYLCLRFYFLRQTVNPFDIKVQLVIIFAIAPCTLAQGLKKRQLVSVLGELS